MKKAISILIASASILCLCFTACCSQPPDSNSDNNIESLYLQAVALGYEGTEEQFAAVISNDDNIKDKLTALEEKLKSDNELLNFFNNLYYTFEEPVYSKDNINELRLLYEVWEPNDGFDIFSNYYSKNIISKSDSSNFIFNPQCGFSIPPACCYSIYAESVDDGLITKPFIIEEWYFYEKELGEYIPTFGDEVADGERVWNLEFLICLAPFDDLPNGKLRLAFGNNYNGKYTDYINIFVGTTCIGTCFYLPNYSGCNNLNVPYTWLATYIKNNLIKGDLSLTP